jgi:lysophospholipase L1-like esterase
MIQYFDFLSFCPRFQNMQFRTEIHPLPSPHKISLQSPILLLGSCFAHEVGARLVQAKLPALVNPFGTIFNPLSLVQLLELALVGGSLPEPSFGQRDGLHFHYALPATFATPDPLALRTRAHDVLGQVARWLHLPAGQPRFVVLTLGTAWAYTLRETSQTVANCHKMPAALFEKRLLSVEEIVQKMTGLMAQLPAEVQVVLTVSPVRHLKDTLPLNTVSKAVLRLACHQLESERAAYFPAFELLTDDLRDYRFYAPDLLHPSPPAIDYIFDKFTATYLDQPAQAFVAKWAKLRAALAHRPLQPGTAAHQHFLRDLLGQLMAIREVDVSAEVAEVRQRLANVTG